MRTTISPTKKESNHRHPEARIDGRRARGERTRLRVLDALLELVAEDQLRPTAQEVASRAGVALRTVYHHFEDVEALRKMALDLQLSRHREMLREVDDTSCLDERVASVTHQLRRLFEAITPIRRATLFDEQASTEIAAGLHRGRALRRQYLERSFANELSKSEGDPKVLLDAVDVATSWENWHFLRSALGRSPSAAEKVLNMTLADLLEQEPDPQHR